MEITLLVLLVLVTLICLLGGINLMLKGAGSFLVNNAGPQPKVDNLFRFLSGIYIGLGVLMIWVVTHMNEVKGLVYCVGIVVVFSGLGRLYSKMKVGSAGKYFDNIMIVELLLGFAIVILQFLQV